MRIGGGVILLMLLAGCFGTPELPLLSDVELAKDVPENGLVSPDPETPKTLLQELESVENGPALEAVPSVELTPQKPRRGFAALFGHRNKPKVATLPDTAAINGTAEDVIVPDNASQPGSEVAALAPSSEGKPVRRGLFGPRRSKSKQRQDALPGVMLPFGQIGLACGLRIKQLGKEVDRFPESGKGYRLYDTDPSTTQPRTHYITGFKDGCSRQFTASLALLESPVLHEQLLSVANVQGQHATAADKVFQKVRAQVCHVGRGKACPEKRIAGMEKSMAFVTTYERFGGNANWNEILLHNGVVAANSFETP